MAKSTTVAGAGGGRSTKMAASNRDAAPLKRPSSSSSFAANKHGAPRSSMPYKKKAEAAGLRGGGGKDTKKKNGKHPHAVDGENGKNAGGNDITSKPLDGVVLKLSSSSSGVVDFGPDDKNAADPGGRRAKKEREMKKKLKAGSFGEKRKIFFPSPFPSLLLFAPKIFITHPLEKENTQKQKR